VSTVATSADMKAVVQAISEANNLTGIARAIPMDEIRRVAPILKQLDPSQIAAAAKLVQNGNDLRELATPDSSHALSYDKGRKFTQIYVWLEPRK
jgi:hypothetical protein